MNPSKESPPPAHAGYQPGHDLTSFGQQRDDHKIYYDQPLDFSLRRSSSHELESYRKLHLERVKRENMDTSSPRKRMRLESTTERERRKDVERTKELPSPVEVNIPPLSPSFISPFLHMDPVGFAHRQAEQIKGLLKIMPPSSVLNHLQLDGQNPTPATLANQRFTSSTRTEPTSFSLGAPNPINHSFTSPVSSGTLRETQWGVPRFQPGVVVNLNESRFGNADGDVEQGHGPVFPPRIMGRELFEPIRPTASITPITHGSNKIEKTNEPPLNQIYHSPNTDSELSPAKPDLRPITSAAEALSISPSRYPATPDCSPATKSRKRKAQPVPTEQKDALYWERRQRNNLAAKKSRDSRRMKEDDTRQRNEYLSATNEILRRTISELENEVLYLQSKLPPHLVDQS